MTLQKQLKQLATQFEAYAPLWQQWKNTHYHSLTPLEKTIIELHRMYDFELKDISGMMASVIDVKNLNHINQKLKKDQDEFKDWVVREMQFGLIKQSKGTDLEIFYQLDFNKLEIPQPLKKSLLAFGCNNLESMFEKYSEEDLKKVPQFKMAQKVLEVIYQLPKTEKDTIAKERKNIKAEIILKVTTKNDHLLN